MNVLNFRWQPRKLSLLLPVLLLAMSTATVAYAHGVVISYTLSDNGEVELYAEFDTGEVMADAQVTIYAPDDPMTPWLTGTSDAEGKYVFVIDPEQPGMWDIQYRKAGHGDMVHLELTPGMINPTALAQAPGELQTGPAPVEQSAPATNSGATMLASGGNVGGGGGFTPLQVMLMSASVIWGFVGTALYFSSRKTEVHAHDHAHGHHH
jgi:nickel transport protein